MRARAEGLPERGCSGTALRGSDQEADNQRKRRSELCKALREEPALQREAKPQGLQEELRGAPENRRWPGRPSREQELQAGEEQGRHTALARHREDLAF